MPCNDEWLIRVLLSNKLLDEPTAKEIRESGVAYASTEILRRGIATKERIARAVEQRYNIPFAEPALESLDKMALSLLPERLCRQYLFVPIKLEGERIEVLMANPSDVAACDAIASVSARAPAPVFGFPDAIEALITGGYSSDSVIFELLKKFPEDISVQSIDDAGESERAPSEPLSIGTPVIQLTNLLIAHAVRMMASDIHIEHDEKMSVVRYRIDGVLRNIIKIPKYLGEGPLVSRVKIMANLDVADRRRPQDGRAKLRVGQEEVGLRVSTIPTAFGEKAVLRILDQRKAEVPLRSLGYAPDVLDRLVRLAHLEQGLLLVTGPTGSGKTTTLYSILNDLKSEDINIVTVEDPIEYRLEGINQIQVNEKAGLDFAAVLRSVLRQDPDVVLVGEIRDRETADIAFQAAQTGHMVFSTLHTNDALSTVNRLLDIGVERYKMAPSLVGIVAQRLVRRVCPGCKAEVPAKPAVAAALKAAGLAERQYEGKGCDRCAFTGLNGRLTVTELLDLSDRAAREALNATPDATTFRAEAVKRGWLKTMMADALWHLSSGDTTLAEIQFALEFDTEAGAAAPAGAAPRPESPRKILVVDDSPNNRLLIETSLKADGYRLSEAENGLVALQEVARSRPDLMILDLMMPEMDGFAVVKRLRNEMGIADLPILVLTALGETESQETALNIGADDYLTKPFVPKILRARVKALFRRHEFGAAGAA